MKLVTAIVRPEKVMDVIKALEQEGYYAFPSGPSRAAAARKAFR